MLPVPPIEIGWLVLLVNAYAPQAKAMAGSDAVPTTRADQAEPAACVGISAEEKRRIAHDLWAVFGAPSVRQRSDALDDVLSVSQLTPHADEQGWLAWSTDRTDPADVLAAGCAVALLAVVTTIGWARLGTCAGCDCVDVFVDRAGRTPRKYCSTTCLNRARVRAYRARQAQA